LLSVLLDKVVSESFHTAHGLLDALAGMHATGRVEGNVTGGAKYDVG
jgi:hypothetical protein